MDAEPIDESRHAMTEADSKETPMSLYEVTNGMTGWFRIRCHIWAQSEEQARAIYAEKHGDDGAVEISVTRIVIDPPYIETSEGD